MDKKSKKLLLLLLIAVIVSFGFLYYKHVVKKNFPIFQNQDGVPVVDDGE